MTELGGHAEATDGTHPARASEVWLFRPHRFSVPPAGNARALNWLGAARPGNLARQSWTVPPRTLFRSGSR